MEHYFTVDTVKCVSLCVWLQNVWVSLMVMVIVPNFSVVPWSWEVLCVCLDTWLVSVVCLLWSLLHMGSFSLWQFPDMLFRQGSWVGVGNHFRCCRAADSRGVARLWWLRVLAVVWVCPPFDVLARCCMAFVWSSNDSAVPSSVDFLELSPFRHLGEMLLPFLSSLFSIFLKTVCNEISEKDNTGQHLHEAGSLLAYSTHQTIDIWYWVWKTADSLISDKSRFA